MRIAVVSSTPIPPVYGGMDRFLEGLCAALAKRHRTDLITIGCDERSAEGILGGYYDFYHLDLSDYDLAISIKAPAFMVRHRNHICYLCHRIRVFYDRFEAGEAEHQRLRSLVHWLDAWALDESRTRHLFAIGDTVGTRLKKFGGRASETLRLPTTLSPATPRPGEYFLSVGRLHAWKRVDLIIQAYKVVEAPCPLKIVGEGPDEESLRELAAGDSRIEFVGRASDRELADLYAGALATIFPPVGEDLGLVTFESFTAGKPVLTASDSGEPALIVEEGRTGFIAEPTPEALGRAIDRMWNDRQALGAMEFACRDAAARVTWDAVADRLLEVGEKLDGDGENRSTQDDPRSRSEGPQPGDRSDLHLGERVAHLPSREK